MPMFPAVDGVPVAVAPRHLAPPLPVEDGRMAAIVAGKRSDGPESYVAGRRSDGPEA